MIRTVTIALALGAMLAQGEVKRTEVTKATSPAEDAKGLTTGMPDSVAVSSKIDRVLMIRLRNQADLLGEIERHVKEQKIKNAVILSGFGSLIAAHYHAVSNREFPSKNLFTENTEISADIISINGAVMNGRVHAHMTMADPEKAFGGHIEPRSKVFTFAVVTLGVLPDSVDLSRFDDKTWR
jgi:predicted DNA-binding protein with PD1-like motif